MYSNDLSWLHLIVITIIVFTISFLLIILFATSLVKNRVQNESYLTQLQMEHHAQILQSELEMQEQTFEQISREIHDNWGQRLSLIKLQLQQMGTGAEVCVSIIEDLLDELRDFSRHMSSSRVKKIGLINSIEEDIAFLRETTSINFQLNLGLDTSDITEQTGLILYRIFQEAESNIIRHSGAQSVIVNLSEKGDEIVMEIIDDGKGFDARNVSTRGIGLHNISKRSRLLNGNCQLLSEPGKGTKIEIKILKD